MGSFDKTVLGVSAVSNLKEAQRQVESVKNSSLSDVEKEKALKSHKNFVITTILVVIIVCLLLGGSVIYGMSLNSEFGMIFIIVSAIVSIIILIAYALLSKKIFGDWTKYNNTVDMGFDGLTKSDIDYLKPTEAERKIIKKLQFKDAMFGIILIIAIIIESIIFNKLEIEFLSPIPLITTIVIVIIWLVNNDNCLVEIHRIKSGYYKKSFGYKCSNCKEEVKINFNEIEKYNTLPKNKDGIRVMKCPKCNNDVPFYNFDINAKDYKNYLSKLK